IDIRLTTIAINMRLPFWGHLLQAVGFMNSSKETIRGFLTGGPGRAVLVIVGGAKEALLGAPGRNDLVLQRRKGFFEIALQTGSSLVPVFSLGENEMYEKIKGDNLICRSLQFVSRKTMALFGFSLPLCYGRGLLQLTMPKRVKILEVVGDPIPCKRIPNPTQKDIDELRQRYCEALQRVYNKAKIAYGPEGRFEDLRIVE
ncbi:dgat2l1-prov protein, putative, partial [Eimeria tenella]